MHSSSKRKKVLVAAMLACGLVVSIALGLLPAEHSVMALDHNDENSCTGTVASPAQLGPYSGTSSSSGISWHETPCVTCTVTEDSPEIHVTEIELDGTKSCPTDEYAGSVYVTFCESMPDVEDGTKIGRVTFRTSQGNVYADLNYMYDLSRKLAYASAPCTGPYLRAVPDEVKVEWGADYSGSGNPSIGNALNEFDIYAHCCDL